MFASISAAFRLAVVVDARERTACNLSSLRVFAFDTGDAVAARLWIFADGMMLREQREAREGTADDRVSLRETPCGKRRGLRCACQQHFYSVGIAITSRSWGLKNNRIRFERLLLANTAIVSSCIR